MEETKRLIEELSKYSYKTVFKALVTFYEGDTDYPYTKEEDEKLNDVYDEYLRRDDISQVLNDDIIELLENLED